MKKEFVGLHNLKSHVANSQLEAEEMISWLSRYVNDPSKFIQSSVIVILKTSETQAMFIDVSPEERLSVSSGVMANARFSNSDGYHMEQYLKHRKCLSLI